MRARRMRQKFLYVKLERVSERKWRISDNYQVYYKFAAAISIHGVC
ncbi:unnamed protein product [Nezara viridula]|uniref:Uncharacterized protein n=1 Tax=Nezara viridula TaxID=85310 RepID=A0A9P0HDY9_NEZVI|nr:unnamed protein product [Nezara viridula]